MQGLELVKHHLRNVEYVKSKGKCPIYLLQTTD